MLTDFFATFVQQSNIMKKSFPGKGKRGPNTSERGEKRDTRAGEGAASERRQDDRGASPKRSFSGPSRERRGGDRPTGRPVRRTEERGGSDRPVRPARTGEERGGSDRPVRPMRTGEERGGSDRPVRPARTGEERGGSSRPVRRSEERGGSDRPTRPARTSEERGGGDRPVRPYEERGKSDRPARSGDGDKKKKKFVKKPATKPSGEDNFFEKKKTQARGWSGKPKPARKTEEKRFFRGKAPKAVSGFRKKAPRGAEEAETPGTTRLNKFIANAGICSRREADDFISAGVVTVNGKIVSELGARISDTDEVKFHDKVINGERKVYYVLNKPKDYITTTDDPLERKTVMALLDGACKERMYPVGRLDRATTGILIFTNDGDLTKRLTHPAHKIKKIYLVQLNRPFTKADYETLLNGVELEDGFAEVDQVTYSTEVRDKTAVIVELHSGRNRIVRRIFEALGYEITRLDRTSFAGITKKELMRGSYRALTEKEVGFLKMQAGLR